ncbi:hypothetical protein BDW62DRAFT_184824 [Aspergillus aurantiobrunneus]
MMKNRKRKLDGQNGLREISRMGVILFLVTVKFHLGFQLVIQSNVEMSVIGRVMNEDSVSVSGSFIYGFHQGRGLGLCRFHR